MYFGYKNNDWVLLRSVAHQDVVAVWSKLSQNGENNPFGKTVMSWRLVKLDICEHEPLMSNKYVEHRYANAIFKVKLRDPLMGSFSKYYIFTRWLDQDQSFLDWELIAMWDP